jgi:putative transposase
MAINVSLMMRKDVLDRPANPRGRKIGQSAPSNRYCSAACQKLFCQHQLIASMSKKATVSFDKAAMKSWNHSFKVEAIHVERLQTRSDA